MKYRQPRDRMLRVCVPAFWVVSVAATVVFFLVRWSGSEFSYAIEKRAVLAYVLVQIGLLLSALLWRSARTPALLIETVNLLVIVGVLLAEAVFWAFPFALPGKVLAQDPVLLARYFSAKGLDQINIIEHLPESPWVKFKPNVLARSGNWLHRGDDFTQEWMTDSLGFKNEPALTSLKRVTALALGDSFVEAMGVGVGETWSSMVSKRGYPVYNLGVQGYAPQQMVGALEKYGERFRPSYVLFGFTPGFEARSLRYAYPRKVVTERKYSGGIESINRYIKEIRSPDHISKLESPHRAFPTVNALLHVGKKEIKRLLVGLTPTDSNGRASMFSQYQDEAAEAASSKFDPTSPSWLLALRAIEEAKAASERIGASPAILLFHHRAFLYYERIFGHPPPDYHYELELTRALREFCARRGIQLVDTYAAFKAYIDSLPETGGRLPFFTFDAHPNQAGQKIIAATVLRFLRDRTQATGNSRG